MPLPLPPRLRPPALDPATVADRAATGYPSPFAERVAGRSRRRLGEALGLKQFGVNLTTLQPGAQSALRHWHAHEDEFVYVLEGEVALVTNDGEQSLSAGMCAGFAAGVRDGHHMVNRSSAAARYLEIGTRAAVELVEYPDDDLLLAETIAGRISLHKDRTPY